MTTPTSTTSTPTTSSRRPPPQQQQRRTLMVTTGRRSSSSSLPRIVLTLLIVFVTCFVYYVEFLWQHQKSIVDTRTFWDHNEKERQHRRRPRDDGWRRHELGEQQGQQSSSSTSSQLRRGRGDGGMLPATATRDNEQPQQHQQPVKAAVSSSSSSSSSTIDETNHRKPPDDMSSSTDGQQRQEQQQLQEEDEETEEDRLKRGIQITPAEIDELTMERKRQSQNFERYSLPPIETILHELDNGTTTVIGNPQPVLDFAIIGFGKCGTTSAMHLLRSHSQLQSLQSEMWALFNADIPKLVNRMYDRLTLALPRGYKCPGDIFSPHSLNLFRDAFPQTKLVIGIRHPVPWFQSLYNFRVQNFDSYESIPSPNHMIGLCTKEMLMACTQRGNFGHFLMKLGKQQYLWNERRHPDYPHGDGVDAGDTSIPKPYQVVPNSLEYNLSHWYDPYGDKRWAYEKWNQKVFEHPLPNPVFLFELNQLSGDAKNDTRAREFQQDLAAFLEVSPDGFHPEPERVSPGKLWDEETQRKKDALKINICDPQHQLAREELMKQSRASSVWIRSVFLKSPGVYSSSTNDHLEQLLEKWMHDPCDEQVQDKKGKTKSSSTTAIATSR